MFHLERVPFFLCTAALKKKHLSNQPIMYQLLFLIPENHLNNPNKISIDTRRECSKELFVLRVYEKQSNNNLIVSQGHVNKSSTKWRHLQCLIFKNSL